MNPGSSVKYQSPGKEHSNTEEDRLWNQTYRDSHSKLEHMMLEWIFGVVVFKVIGVCPGKDFRTPFPCLTI